MISFVTVRQVPAQSVRTQPIRQIPSLLKQKMAWHQRLKARTGNLSREGSSSPATAPLTSVSWRCRSWDHSQPKVKLKTSSWMKRRFRPRMWLRPWREFLPVEPVQDKSLGRSRHLYWASLSLVRYSCRKAPRPLSKMNLKSGSTRRASGIRAVGISTWSWPPSSSSITSSNATVDNSLMRPYSNIQMNRQGISKEMNRAGRSSATNRSNRLRSCDLRSGRRRRLNKLLRTEPRRRKRSNSAEKRPKTLISLHKLV